MVLFPFFLTSWFIKILYINKSVDYLFHGFIITFSILLIRTFVLFLYLRDHYTWFNIMYYPCYLFLLLPTKIFAFFTIVNNNWVTQPRFHKTYITCSLHLLFLIMWSLFLLTGIALHVVRLVFSISV
jgi:hypothetical protein